MPEDVKEAIKTEEPAGNKKLKKKKLRPTNCVQSNKRIHRKDWYYRNGKYFANKKCFKLYQAQEVEKAKKAQSEKPAEVPPSQA